MSSGFTQGYYTPKNPSKYLGDLTKIRYMSSWELSLHLFLDNNPNVLKWASEPIGIPYTKPTDGHIHKYYPDYYVEYIDKNNELHKEIIEVKPHKQLLVSKTRNKKNKLYEDIQYAINKAKWDACILFCNKHGFKFRILTEKQLFG